MIATIDDREDKNQPSNYAACGAFHLDHSDGSAPDPREGPCGAGREGILYRVQVTGDEWENTRTTRCRPADGSPFRDHELVRADLGPHRRHFGQFQSIRLCAPATSARTGVRAITAQSLRDSREFP